VDDVAFTRALLDDLAAAVHVDEDRIFATGMSNGGMMVYRLAAELSDRIAAIAPVGGPMSIPPGKPSRPVPVVHFHGTEDRLAPFHGGRGEGKSAWSFESVEDSIGAWVRANGCARDPEVETLPDLESDGTKVVRKTYGEGRAGSEVVLYVIEGGGHTWPGGPMDVGALGATTREISANDTMWEFFQRHPRRP
jgi:polyhydroxybutyrate depolymerase